MDKFMNEPPNILPPKGLVMPAWKMVDAEHADAVERGSLLIGTLAGYKQLENGRADALDGGVEYYSSQPMFKGDPASEVAMRRLGIDAHLAVNVTTRIVQPPTYAFCMAKPGCMHDPTPEKQKAVFAISDAIELSYAITRKFAEKFARVGVGEVRYEKRRFDVFGEEPSDADPWVKDLIFEPEMEIRIAWLATSQATPFVTGEDEELARFLTRIR